MLNNSFYNVSVNKVTFSFTKLEETEENKHNEIKDINIDFSSLFKKE